MGAKTEERFLSLADTNFVDDVKDDLNCFLRENDKNRVLVFPPVSNYRRFLIHNCVEAQSRSDLSTFSIGVSDERRTVVCYRDRLLSDVACAGPSHDMGLTQISQDHITQPGPAGEVESLRRSHAQPKTSRSASAKPRRPDRAVYVPRALRSSSEHHADEQKPPDARLRNQTETNAKCPKPSTLQSNDKSQPGTPKRSTKNFCNVYTPPHLRDKRSPQEPGICYSNDTSVDPVPSACPQVPNGDSAIPIYVNDFMDTNVGESFYIGDYFANGQLGFYRPEDYYDYNNDVHDENRIKDGDAVLENNEVYSDKSENEFVERHTDETIEMTDNRPDIIRDSYSLGYNNKDEDIEENVLKRASQEINRSSKRIIKQSFDSDVLVISDPVGDKNLSATVVEKTEEVIQRPKQKLEAKVSLKREENDWDTVFDDSGECLDPSLLEELTATVGKVHVSKAKNNYEQYQTRGQALFNGPYDETFAHVVEVYDFPSEFKTNDLLSVFKEYKDTGFEIKWVDDTHALIVFSSAKIASEVLSNQRPMVRCRPLHAATLESRNKAKKCAEFLQPYRQRPETCTALARRLVSGALGVRLSTARQERDEERRLITMARERRRQAALHKEAAWEGSLTSQPLNHT